MIPKDNVYRVPNSRMAELAIRIGKLNKRAKKLGVPEVVVNNVGTETVKLVSRDNLADAAELGYDGGTSREVDMLYVPRQGEVILGIRTYQKLTVSGETPKLAGWSFLGTLQHLQDEDGKPMTILRSVPGEHIPSDYRTRDQFCDHCKKNRRRRDTYIVRHETGSVKQVGSDCIKDFLGGVSPEHVLAMMEILLSAQDLLGGESGEGFGFGSDDMAIYRDSYLEHVAAIVRTKGWLSRTKARDFGGQATADVALDYFVAKNRHLLPKLDITDEDKKLAEAAVEWGKSLTGVNRDGTDNDYEWNLKASLVHETLKARTEGLVASVIASYTRHMERELRMKHKAESSKSEFVGAVGKRDVFDVVLVSEPTYHDSDFGGYYIHKFVSGDNELVWFGNSKLDVEPGEAVRVKATVKRHDVRNGVKQTVINRVTKESK